MSKKKSKKKPVARHRTPKQKPLEIILRDRPLDPLNQLPPYRGHLHAKKLLIMADAPIIPCSAITKDRYGLMYAHTQAEKIYQLYAEKCREHKLVIRMVDCKIETTKYPDIFREKWESVECVLATCKFEICDTESSETEAFMGAGLGDNAVWSANSAQTVAMKQALIQYFFTAWPQPTDYCAVIRNELAGFDKQQYMDAVKNILPKPPKDLPVKDMVKELVEFFEGKFPDKK